MRKILLSAIGLLIFLAGCTNVVKDEKFIFEEKEFKSVYEDVNDKNLPTNVKYYPELISMQNGNKDDAINFLNATAELLESKEISRLSESVESNEDNIPDSINGEGFSVGYYNEHDVYDIYIRPFETE
ncbi:hypothetical protein J32TS6_05100 [Virgibacillus pantothenticus]|uniref:hypothetical protein n=1 Tax=Virgibacillus pantothenticus TaxID=1473 RepID=UPI001B1B133A|nr:hypothetical protein [Virgibacillus pantothenticus]GIP61955.1 hypothetical protein J32TS6_05100 [Virgibacillus pantothenticus]